MNLRQGRKLISLYAVDVFLDAHKERLPKATAAGMRERFGRTLAELELHVRTQSAAPITAEGLTKAMDAKREVLLRDHMAPIASIAKLEAENHPALAPLKMPRGDPGVQKLLAHAAGMASVAQDYREVFIAAGMAPTFVEDLNTAIEDVLATLTARTERHAAGAGATVGLRSTLDACNRYKAVLDAFIKTEASNDPDLLAHWHSVKRVERLPGRRRRRAGVNNGAMQRELTPEALPIRDPARLLAAPIPDSLTAHQRDVITESRSRGG